MVWTGKQIVGVGGERTLASSPDGVQWTVKSLPTDVRSLEWNGSRFVAVGNSILTSNEGAIWSVQLADFTTFGFKNISLQSVKWLDDQFVAVGTGSDTTRTITDQYRMVVLTSPDGLDWTLRDGGKARNSIYDVAWSGKLFVMVGVYERILTSPDGINWTVRNETEDINQMLWSVTWTGNHFVTVGVLGSRGVTYTSEDGLTWSRKLGEMNVSRLIWTGSPDSGAFGLLAVGAGGVYSSKNGDNWELLSDSAKGVSVVWTGDRLVLGSYHASPDGRNWTRNGGAKTTVTLNAVTRTAGLGSVAVGGFETILISQNGIDWTLRNSERAYKELFSVAWAPEVGFVAVGDDREDWGNTMGIALFSPDGVQWTRQVLGRISLRRVTWAGDKFVAAGFGDTVYISVDGLQWTKANKRFPATYLGMAWTGKQVVAVGQAGSIITSPDGVQWTVRDSGATSKTLNDVVWTGDSTGSGGQLVAVGIKGLVMTSPDGIAWTERNSGTTEAFQSVAWSGRWLVASTLSDATASSGNVYSSSDGGITWRAFLTGSFNAHNAVTWAGDKLILAGYGGHILTAADDEPVRILVPRKFLAKGLSLRLAGNTLIFTLPPGAAHITSSEMAVAIYTLSGRRVHSNPRLVLSNSQGKLSIAPLTPGPYLLELQAKGNRFARPFILGR